MGSSNHKLFEILGITEEKPYFDYKETQIYAFFNPPHLIKRVRSNLMKYKFKLGEQTISWDHVVSFVSEDSKRAVKLAPKITNRHINVNSFAKMRVKLPLQKINSNNYTLLQKDFSMMYV